MRTPRQIMDSIILIAIGTLLSSSSVHGLNNNEFADYVGDKCFRREFENEPALFVNGQERPLASTMENFINLVEKFESVNQNMPLKEVIFTLLRNYTYENWMFEKDTVRQYTFQNRKEYNYEKFWEPDDTERVRVPHGADPFTTDERCSLFFMLSHTVLPGNPGSEGHRMRAYININDSFEASSRTDMNFGLEFPHELGVVAVRGSEAAVSPSRVLAGIYVGLRDNRRMLLDQNGIFGSINVKQGEILDPLYAITLAEVLITATWPPEQSQRGDLALNGEWHAVSQLSGDDTICPNVYKLAQSAKTPIFSYSTVRGAADGLILGQLIHGLHQKHHELRLSQLLRMYYSRAGIRAVLPDFGVDPEVDRDSGREEWASFCNRMPLVDRLKEHLLKQMEVFVLLTENSRLQKAEDYAHVAATYFDGRKRDIFNMDMDVSLYCSGTPTVDNPELWTLETPLDVLVVMDTNIVSTEDFERQQLIIGHLAKRMDLRIRGSSMTVLLDRKSGQAGLELQSVVDQTNSAACAACNVTHFVLEDDSTGVAAPTDEVVVAIDKWLYEKAQKEDKKQGTNGKVVVYFNFLADETTTPRLLNALKQLHLRHIDVPIFALGRNKNVLMKYARRDSTYIILAIDGEASNIGAELYKMMAKVPAFLQYDDCNDGRNEKGLYFEDFVTETGIQHWAMPARYFLKSRRAVMRFEAQYGQLQVCYNRATYAPEVKKSKCLTTSRTNRHVEFVQRDPCHHFNEITCPPFYFAIMGLNETEENGDKAVQTEYCRDTIDKKCKTLDQVKFRVTHEGIRCSGCPALISTPLAMLLSLLFAHVFAKHF